MRQVTSAVAIETYICSCGVGYTQQFSTVVDKSYSMLFQGAPVGFRVLVMHRGALIFGPNIPHTYIPVVYVALC